MLVKLYTRSFVPQRIVKGLSVCGPASPRALGALADTFARSPASRTTTLQGETRNAKALWLDAGRAQLHTFEARERYFSHLAEGLAEIRDAARRAGVRLLPLPTDPSVDGPLRDRTGGAGDRHSLFPSTDGQKEVMSNFFRLHLPTLIAQAGNSIVAGGQVHPSASLRLQHSTRHYTARYVSSFSPAHLSRMRAWLQRDEGISDLALLDIDPVAADGGIELRFVDAQSSLAGVRAHAILFQAMTMRSCRLHEQGRRVPATPLFRVDRNRALAIAHGANAVFMVEPPERPTDEGRRRSRSATVPLRATHALLELIESLVPELQCLEATATEIGPLFLGAELRELGFPALVSEGDVQRHHLASRSQHEVVDILERELWPYATTIDDGPLMRINRTNATRWSSMLTEAWAARLAAPAVSARRRLDARELLRAAQESRAASDIVAIMIRQLGGAGRVRELIDLDGAARTIERDDVATLKRALRPPAPQRVRVQDPPSGWDDPLLGRLREHIASQRPALLVFEAEDDALGKMRTVAERLSASAPAALVVVLLHAARWNDGAGVRSSLELLICPSADTAAAAPHETTAHR